MRDVHLAVVKVETVRRITEEFVVVNPNVLCALYRDGVISDNLVDHQISNYNVGFPNNFEAAAIDDSGCTDPND
jgi:hypothetical protein